MRVLKIQAEGITTSFRLPHFMHGIQPTFRMPPPATIYGHICSALGELISPESVAFAYRFTSEATFFDLEHTILLTEARGKLKGTSFPQAISGGLQPFKREILFRPRLTLYLTRPDWLEAFRRPRYAVVLGRSQDLFTYTSVEQIELVQAQEAYFEHTLLPRDMVRLLGRGHVELLPRYLDYERKRAPTFSHYLVLEGRASSREFWFEEEQRQQRTGQSSRFWVDPTSPVIAGMHLGLMFHTFGETPYAAFPLA
ncbi:type I-B CRISPR-associated protein Cas5b [Thermogemmatispora onikobensis]|uniref:type I-B CRISPR-associated protein Cas5b n=1 Tax=Thermogemmatispora onikobensis TaxID=732234 RepID=UPI000853C2FB|nr:type I-B CRISPR-associated protein Cas5b [Thermogemmatispora onikobensis]